MVSIGEGIFVSATVVVCVAWDRAVTECTADVGDDAVAWWWLFLREDADVLAALPKILAVVVSFWEDGEGGGCCCCCGFSSVSLEGACLLGSADNK